MLRHFLSLTLALLFTACGSDSSDAPADTTEAPPTTATADPASGTPDAMPADAPTLPSLTPAEVSTDDPVPARELRDAVFGMMGQIVAVQGVAMGASPLGNGLRLSTSASPNFATDPVVECETGTVPNPMPSGEVTVQGTVAAPNLAGQTVLKLTDCSLVDGGDVMAVDALADRIVGWVGKEVAIVGTYNGEVTSQLSGSPKTVVRVQDAGAEGLAEQVAGCELEDGASVPGAATTEREGVVFQGTISDLQNWPRRELSLTNCRITNR